MATELQLSKKISQISDKSARIDDVAKRLSRRSSEWQFWRSHDKSLEEQIMLYEWRNELDRQIPQRVIEYAKETPGTYDLENIQLKVKRSEGESLGTPFFKYGFSVVTDSKRVCVDFETEGVVTIADNEVKSPKIEVIGKDVQPILHLPTNWTLLIADPQKSMHRWTYGYAKWQPELLDTPRKIKIPNDLEITFTLHYPDEAQTYTETEVLA